MDPRIDIIEADKVESYVKAKEPFILDVREPYEFDSEHIEGAVNIPLRALVINSNAVPSDRPVLCYCAHGVRSMKAARLLTQRNYKNIAHIESGLAGMGML
jgi:rhodanese-related sulfurtransferase